MSSSNDPNELHKEYSDQGFWDKVKDYAKVMGESVLLPAFKLYHVAQDSDTPVWAKTMIYSALAYFILPVDAIPDVVPVVGYTDDLGALAAAAATIVAHIKPEHTEKAKETLKQWID